MENESLLSLLCLFLFNFGLFLGYFLGRIESKLKSKKVKTETMTIALNPSIRVGTTIQAENAIYKVLEVGHIASGSDGRTTLTVKKLKRGKS